MILNPTAGCKLGTQGIEHPAGQKMSGRASVAVEASVLPQGTRAAEREEGNCSTRSGTLVLFWELRNWTGHFGGAKKYWRRPESHKQLRIKPLRCCRFRARATGPTGTATKLQQAPIGY